MLASRVIVPHLRPSATRCSTPIARLRRLQPCATRTLVPTLSGTKRAPRSQNEKKYVQSERGGHPPQHTPVQRPPSSIDFDRSIKFFAHKHLPANLQRMPMSSDAGGQRQRLSLISVSARVLPAALLSNSTVCITKIEDTEQSLLCRTLFALQARNIGRGSRLGRARWSWTTNDKRQMQTAGKILGGTLTRHCSVGAGLRPFNSGRLRIGR